MCSSSVTYFGGPGQTGSESTYRVLAVGAGQRAEANVEGLERFAQLALLGHLEGNLALLRTLQEILVALEKRQQPGESGLLLSLVGRSR